MGIKVFVSCYLTLILQISALITAFILKQVPTYFNIDNVINALKE